MRRFFAWVLILAGALALAWSVTEWTTGLRERAERARALPSIPVATTPSRGETLGLIQIPRLSLSVVVVEGDDPDSLKEGAGHLPDTPMPWRGGNSVLAGHRDTDFRPLRGIRVGDRLTFRTADATFDFTVTETRVVEPTDLSVLEASRVSTLTLITCYPFSYVGPAPQRFVVRAERIGGTEVPTDDR
jgi:sortase A